MAPFAALGTAPPDDKVARDILLRKTMVSVPHFALDDSDGEDSTDAPVWEAADMTLPGVSAKGGGLEQFPVDEDSEDEVDGDDWVRIIELLELEDQYRFDPESVAEMVDGGADLQHLSDHLCEAHLPVAVAGLEPPVRDDPSTQPAPRAARSTTDPTDWMRPPLRRSDRSSPDPLPDLTDWMRPTPRSSPSSASMLKRTTAAAASGQKPGAGDRPRQRRDAAARALSSARKILSARCEAGEEVSEKLKLVEEALADARRRHRSSVAKAVQWANAQGSSEALGSSTQSLREGRIQEAVSLAMALSHSAKEGSSPRRKRPTRRRLALAMEQYQAASPTPSDTHGLTVATKDGVAEPLETQQKPKSKTRQEWIVVGGHDTGGLIVRSGESLQSQELSSRLAFGARVECLQISGKRLRFQKLQGQGPAHGWVSLELAACRSPLVVPVKQKQKQRRPTVTQDKKT
eukprot:TRINITY_DN7483_c0_g1_i2.p1 TRINITY_DN7483_c0_g1~~TRINITY_DN7483_c0_g1_i2.p1  ORF type:complete len:460 (-),score=82.25 TRINITY_DN7483_c0_g1_i2:12-1391(-)